MNIYCFEFGGLNYPGHEVCMSLPGYQVLLYYVIRLRFLDQ